MSAVDPLTFLRSKPLRQVKCRYATVRDALPDDVRNALLAVEDDREVESTRILALIRMHDQGPLGITSVRRHRAPEGCPTCIKETT